MLGRTSEHNTIYTIQSSVGLHKLTLSSEKLQKDDAS